VVKVRFRRDVEPPQTHYFAGVSNGASRVCAVLRLPNSFRSLPLPLSLACLGNVSRLRSAPYSILPTAHSHPTLRCSAFFPFTHLIPNHFQSLFYIPSADLPTQR
jgi:hypothetical protein